MAAKQIFIHTDDGGRYRLSHKFLRGEGRWTTRAEIQGAFKKHRTFVNNGYINDRERLTNRFKFEHTFETTLEKAILRIGCKVFSGVNFEKLRKWALVK